MPADPHRNDALSGMGTGWAVTSTMIGGIAVWGAVGYLVDRLLGTDNLFMAIGFVLGAVGATYIVWLRYGREQGGQS